LELLSMLNKANAILSLFTPERTELAVLEIAELLGRPRSSVYRILGKMADAGFLDQDPVSGRYRVGMRLAMLGEVARHSTSLQRVAWPWLCHVSEVTGELASLMVRSGNEGVTVDLVESFHPLKIPGHLGGRFPLHATAGGKVLLAWRSEDDIDELLQAPLERSTANTITAVPKLKRELELTRTRGYAMAPGEWVEDVFAVAAPIRDHRNRVIAAVGAASPEARWNPRSIKVMTDAAVHAANEISRALGHFDHGALNGRRGRRPRPARTGGPA
jgi:DNA-binding IclR family transcriptional regulator